MRIHHFAASNGIGGIGEAVFYSLLSSLGTVKSVNKDREWQKKGVDFLFEEKKFDTKFDTQAPNTGNIAIETISKIVNDKVIKKGWAYTSEADAIVYMYLKELDWKLLFFSPEEARNLIDGHAKKTVWNKGYSSEVVLVPESKFTRFIHIPVAGCPNLSELEDIIKEI